VGGRSRRNDLHPWPQHESGGGAARSSQSRIWPAILKGAECERHACSGLIMIDNSPWSYKLQNGRDLGTPAKLRVGTFRAPTLAAKHSENSIKQFRWQSGHRRRHRQRLEVWRTTSASRTALPAVARAGGLGSINPIGVLEAYQRFVGKPWRTVEAHRGSRHPGQGRQSTRAFETRRDNRVSRPPEYRVLNDFRASVVKRGNGQDHAAVGYSNPPGARVQRTTISQKMPGLRFSQRNRGGSLEPASTTEGSDSERRSGARKYKFRLPLTARPPPFQCGPVFVRPGAKLSRLVYPDPPGRLVSVNT